MGPAPPGGDGGLAERQHAGAGDPSQATGQLHGHGAEAHVEQPRQPVQGGGTAEGMWVLGFGFCVVWRFWFMFVGVRCDAVKAVEPIASEYKLEKA